MNQKTQKIAEEIAKTKEKILKSQNRLKEQERQLVEAQNAEIIATVRAVDVKPEELRDVIAQLRIKNSELRVSNGGNSLEN